MSDLKTLYDEDFVAWSKQQAEALRSAERTGSNQALDWENLAEEIEDLGRSTRRELRSQLRRVIRHLAKIEYSSAIDPRRGWRESVRDGRQEIRDLLAESPSLRQSVADYIADAMHGAVEQALADLLEYDEIAPAEVPRLRQCSYSQEQVLGDWLPPEPSR